MLLCRDQAKSLVPKIQTLSGSYLKDFYGPSIFLGSIQILFLTSFLAQIQSRFIKFHFSHYFRKQKTVIMDHLRSKL